VRRRPAAWRRHARAECPGCHRSVTALRSPTSGNLLLVEHHRPRTHVICEPTPGAGIGHRWWAAPSSEVPPR